MRPLPVDLRSEEITAYCRCTFQVLERRKRKMLDTVEGWAPEWLTYAPGPEAWSMLQLFDHLIRTERSVRETSERNLAQQQSRASLRERWRAGRFLFMFRLPIRVRVPRAASFVQPGRPTSIASVVQEWNEERHFLYDFLARQGKNTLQSTAMRHPAIGAMSLRNALRFLVVHLQHHEFQVLRLRWAVSQAFL